MIAGHPHEIAIYTSIVVNSFYYRGLDFGDSSKIIIGTYHMIIIIAFSSFTSQVEKNI